MNSPVQFKLWRKSFLAQFELHFYEGIYHEDELFTFSALMCAKRVVCINDVLYEYYRRPNSIMTQPFTFRHIESMIVLIDEIKRIAESGNYTQPVSDAIQRHIADFYVETEKRMVLFGVTKLPETSALFDSRKKGLYEFIRYMAARQYQYSFTEEQIRHIKSFEHVIVYGAGLVARKVIPELLKNGIENIDVAVSHMDENTKPLFRFPVKEISEIDYPKDKCVVIIAVGKKLAPEIKNTLSGAGYENIFLFETL